MASWRHGVMAALGALLFLLLLVGYRETARLKRQAANAQVTSARDLRTKRVRIPLVARTVLHRKKTSRRTLFI
jgi:hypothetical protein